MNTTHATQASPIPQPPDRAMTSGPPLYVATDLASAFPEDPEEDELDIWIGQKLHRRLTPNYYAWLRLKMTSAKQAHDSGRLPPAAFETMRERFNRIHAWAEGRFGTEALRVAIRRFDPAGYRPPGKTPLVRPSTVPPAPAYLYPSGGEWRFHEAVSPAAIAKVDAIRDIALSLDWTRQRLYQNRGRFGFPLGEDYGLVCFVDGPPRIGAVTKRFIEIIHGSALTEPSVLRFYNPDAPQPWNRKKEKGTS